MSRIEPSGIMIEQGLGERDSILIGCKNLMQCPFNVRTKNASVI